MPPSRLLSSAILVGATMSGCSSDSNGPEVAQGTISWTDNGTRHSLRAPQAGLVLFKDEDPPRRSFFITSVVDGGAVLDISATMNHRFSTGDYRCDSQKATESAEILYGLSMETKPPAVHDCLLTIHQIGIKYSGIVSYTVGTFSGTIVVGTEQHDLTDGSFSAPTAGLDADTD